LLVIYFDASKKSGIKLITPIPSGLPSFQLPTMDLSAVRELAGSATAIAFLGLLEAIAMAKSIAAKTGQKLDMNQQCLSEGLANVVGSLFQCFPGSGSLTRSYINHTSGAATQWSGVFSAAGVAAAILFLAPYAAYIPDASLAGVLVLTATRMTDVASLRYHLKATRFDAVILVATALSAILISVEYCILVGVLLSFAFYVARAANINISELMVTQDRVIREIQPDDPKCTQLRIYNLEGELFFGCAPEFERILGSVAADCKLNAKVIILRLKRVRNPDAVCLHILEKFIEEMLGHDRSVMLSGVSASMFRSFENVGIKTLIGRENIFLEEAEIWASTMDAMRRAYEILGTDRCEHCPNFPMSGRINQEWSYMI
jgi:sulfate permease, SulP family